ncbi:hypothetical protein LMG667_03360 [Xanthomonas euvesicatoria]|uniref:hypothetical protein n=1 Tax=Xanthomonas euvesicatoria TaxID=456327 RepID=UPI00080DD5A3|nr:hypothetical protein [Xanthomonas euvesicatoria]OCG90023.1 hypothetical protein LMG667_03360 [Xanthomonas euvesicatoria]
MSAIEFENWQVLPGRQEGNGDDSIVYPFTSRREVIGDLMAHALFREAEGEPLRIAWWVQPGEFDRTGMTDQCDEPLEERFNERWEGLLADRGELIFAEAFGTSLALYLDKSLATDLCPEALSAFACPRVHGDDSDAGDYGFELTADGWMVLGQVKGLGELAWAGQQEMERALVELEPEQLRKLYRLVKHVDVDTSAANISDGMAYHYGMIRSRYEDGWQLEDEDELEGSAMRP